MTAQDGFLLATLALQMGIITHNQWSVALQQWGQAQANGSKESLAEVLTRLQFVQADDLSTLNALVARHHGQPIESIIEPTQIDELAEALKDAGPAGEQEALRSLQRTVRESQDGSRASRPNDAGAYRQKAPVLTELNSSNQRFRLLRPRALGGLGIVSVAHDVELDREVAVKEMKHDDPTSDAVQRFLSEARVTGQLDHPGIPPVYAVGYFEDGRPFYVMRLIDGVTLKEAIKQFHRKYPPPNDSRERNFEFRKLLGAMVSVCNTVSFAHSKNVLHRDLKPSNIMLGEFGETLVLDWGLAKSQEQSKPMRSVDLIGREPRRKPEDPNQTGTGSVLGTPHYMSPEQARGEWESFNARSDIYSLGATLYTLLTGKLPFPGSTRDEVMENVRQGKLVPPILLDRRVSPALNAVCMKAMALERENRFATADELASELERWLADEPVESYREPATHRWQRWMRARQSLVYSIAVLMSIGFVALIVAGFVVSIEHNRAVHQVAIAEKLTAQAENRTKQARALVTDELLVDFERRFANSSAGQHSLVELANAAVELLQRWSEEDPEDPEYLFDLANALRERARFHRFSNAPKSAWADLTRVVSISERMLSVSDNNVRSKFAWQRARSLIDMSQLHYQIWNNCETGELIETSRQLTERIASRNSGRFDVRTSIALIDMLDCDYQLDRYNLLQAIECAQRAASQVNSMLLEATEKDLTVFPNGAFDLRDLAVNARTQLAQGYYRMHARSHADQIIEQIESVFRQAESDQTVTAALRSAVTDCRFMQLEFADRSVSEKALVSRLHALESELETNSELSNQNRASIESYLNASLALVDRLLEANDYQSVDSIACSIWRRAQDIQKSRALSEREHAAIFRLLVRRCQVEACLGKLTQASVDGAFAHLQLVQTTLLNSQLEPERLAWQAYSNQLAMP